MDKYQKALIRRLEWIDEQAKPLINEIGLQFNSDKLFRDMGEDYFVSSTITVILFRICNLGFLTQNDMNQEYHKSLRKFITERYEKEIREYYSQHKK